MWGSYRLLVPRGCRPMLDQLVEGSMKSGRLGSPLTKMWRELSTLSVVEAKLVLFAPFSAGLSAGASVAPTSGVPAAVSPRHSRSWPR